MNVRETTLDQQFAKSLVEVLKHRAESHAEKPAIIFIGQGGEESERLTYLDLHREATKIAGYLQTVTKAQDRVLLIFQPGPRFVTGFFGCLYAGVIAVPAYPPKEDRTLGRLKSIVLDANLTVGLTDKITFGELDGKLQGNSLFSKMNLVNVEAIDHSFETQWTASKSDGSEIAFIQYSSGSTGEPKGVVLSHFNLMANLKMIKAAMNVHEESKVISWLPLYHDMGLIGGILQPIFSGASTVLMAPNTFLAKPLIWLQTITKYRGSITGAPNFGFELCTKRISDSDLTSLDLSSLKVVFNGAEPVRLGTMTRFIDRFRGTGLNPESIMPVYGLAEATLFVSGGPPGRGVKSVRSTSSTVAEKEREFVSCGSLPSDEQIKIVSPYSLKNVGSDGNEGEIWINGPHIASKYWDKPDQSHSTFEATLIGDTNTYLRTGDLGFLKDDHLYVTGRLKDILIISGKNYYPNDIETTVEQSSPLIRAGCCAVFGYSKNESSEKIGVCFEVSPKIEVSEFEDLRNAVVAKVSNDHGLALSMVTFIKSGTLPKTSSGKLQRGLTRQFIEEGTLELLYNWKRDADLSSSAAETSKTSEAAISKPCSDLLKWLTSYASKKINSRLMDERRSIPPNIILDFGNRGLLGMMVPKAYGGPGFSNRELATVIEHLATIDLNLATFVGLNNGLGIFPILKYGSDSLKNKLLPVLATGRELAAFAITEEGAGSNPKAIIGLANRDESNNCTIHSSKIWIGSGSWAGVINVFVKENDELGRSIGVSGFSLSSELSNLKHGPEALTMGVRGMVQNTVHFEGVLAEPETRLGQPGRGMEVAYAAMNYSRFGIAAICLGGLRRCLQIMDLYCSRRRISTGLLADNPNSIIALSQIAYAAEALRALVDHTAGQLDAEANIPTELFATCKILAPEFLWDAADSLMQILGGRGYIDSNPASQIMRDARLMRIFEGPTEALESYLGHLFLSNRISSNLGISETNHQRIDKDAKHFHSIVSSWNSGDDVQKGNAIAQKLGRLFAIQLLLTICQKIQSRSDVCIWIEQFYEENKSTAVKELTMLASTQAQDLRRYVDELTDSVSPTDTNCSEVATGLDPLLELETNFKNQLPPLENLQKVIPQTLIKPTASLNGETSPSAELKPLPPVKLDPVTKVSGPSSTSNREIESHLTKVTAKILNISSADIDLDKPFAEYGLDSISAIELSSEISDFYLIPVPETLFWDYPTLRQVAEYLATSSSRPPT